MIKNSTFFVIELVALMCVSLLVVSCSDDDDPVVEIGNNVQLNTIGALGEVLVDSEGTTLYFFSKDVSGESTCSDGCLDSWPIFYLAELNLSDGLEASDFGAITRADGARQTTYKGWPLYYFSGDIAPNDVNGEGAGDTWFVAKPDYTVMLANQDIDGESTTYLVNDLGRSLFFFANDEPNVSNCSGGCLDAWPVFDRELPAVVPSTISSAGFDQIDANNGGKQLIYQGKPLYYFAQEQKEVKLVVML